MLWVPQKGRVRTVTNGGIVGSATPGTAIPSNATTLLDGAVTEVIASGSNDQDSWGILVQCWNQTSPSGVAAEAALDILIGGATDDVLIAALLVGGASPLGATAISGGPREYFFPVHIPQGKRIAAIHASVRTSINLRLLVTLFGGGVPPGRVGRKVTTYGSQINNARGQAVTPSQSGAAASATEMSASTSEDHFAFLPGFQCSTDTTVAGTVVNLGIGVGASTEDRIGTWWCSLNSSECQTAPIPSEPALQDVPAGSRLTLLASNSGTNDSAYDGLIYAVS